MFEKKFANSLYHLTSLTSDGVSKLNEKVRKYYERVSAKKRYEYAIITESFANDTTDMVAAIRFFESIAGYVVDDTEMSIEDLIEEAAPAIIATDNQAIIALLNAYGIPYITSEKFERILEKEKLCVKMKSDLSAAKRNVVMKANNVSKTKAMFITTINGLKDLFDFELLEEYEKAGDVEGFVDFIISMVEEIFDSDIMPEEIRKRSKVTEADREDLISFVSELWNSENIFNEDEEDTDEDDLSGDDLDEDDEEIKPTGDSKKEGFLTFVNKASILDLCTLPTIGKVRAREIHTHVITNGNFSSVDELTAYLKLNAKEIEKLKEYIDANY